MIKCQVLIVRTGYIYTYSNSLNTFSSSALCASVKHKICFSVQLTWAWSVVTDTFPFYGVTFPVHFTQYRVTRTELLRFLCLWVGGQCSSMSTASSYCSCHNARPEGHFDLLTFCTTFPESIPTKHGPKPEQQMEPCPFHCPPNSACLAL